MTDLTKALWAGAGGFVGSALRYLIGGFVQSAFPASAFPYGTMAVNITGCFVIGCLSQAIETHAVFGPAARTFAVVGVLGGYTTFSAFGNETVNLMRDGQPVAAGLNVAGHLVLALGAVWCGRVVAQAVWR
ncbi:MAG: fluoride efflux transporter CrcB [Acidobacteriota bacterium]